MKKITLFSFSLFAFALMSCKKNYTCECTYSDGNGYTESTERDISKTSKKNAKAMCGNYTTTYTYSGAWGGSGTTSDTETNAFTCILK